MSLHFFVDGYNVIRSVDWLMTGTLRDQRERLLRFIDEKSPQGSARNNVTVVFDGRPDVSSPRDICTSQVLYSHGGDADDLIKRRVDELANPRAAVVVTDDRAIQRWVKGVGARVMSSAEFLRGGTRAAPPKKGPPGGLDAQARADIDNEFKKIWRLTDDDDKPRR